MTVSRALLPFSTSSPWRLGVADTAEFAPDADPRHSALAAIPRAGAVWVNYDAWSHPVYQATETDPLCTVTDIDHGGKVTRIRIPADARPAKGSDGHLHVVAPDKKTVDEHWMATRTGPTTFTCRRHETTNLAGSGMGPQGGTRAYGGSALGGLIRSWEIKAGRIDHPLAIALRQEQMRPGPVWPASSDDGSTGYAGPVPMGTYLAIPRSVDLTTLGLKSNAALLVAQTLQQFGAYVTDSSGAAALYIEDDPDPATAAWHAELTGPNWSARDLPPIFRALRVVTNNTKATPNGGSAADRRLH